MLLDDASLEKLSQVDPEILEFLKTNPLPPRDITDESKLRMMQAVKIPALPAVPDVVESYLNIPMRDGFKSMIKVHAPASKPHDGSPLIVIFYGGGWVTGSLENHTPDARAFVRLFGAVVVNPSYRLAPDHRFPVGQQDAYDSVKWIAEHATELGADPTKGFIISGFSAGAANTAVATHKAVEDKLSPPITGQWLAYPAILDEEELPEKYKPYYKAWEQNKDSPGLNRAGLEGVKKVTQLDPKSPLRNPLKSSAPLSEIPPTYIQALGADPLRDDALIYDEVLKEAGVKTKIDVYPGHPHWHFPGTEITKKLQADVGVGVGWLLGKEITREETLKAIVG